MQYRVLLRKKEGGVGELTPYGIEKITRDAVGIDLGKAKKLFPSVACSLESPEGPIHMLIGMDHMKNAPKEQERGGGVMLYKSEFNTGHVACGNMNKLEGLRVEGRPEPKVLSCRSTLFNPPEFIPAGAMGTELPRRCPKECRFRMDSFSFENTEYEIILSKLKLDEERKRWVAGYLFNTMIERLVNNYNQARGCMGKMEARLAKTGRLQEFNRQFQDNVDRGVLKALFKEEARKYKGPVNCISMMEAFKTGPHATTQLRICMNSSMRQPRPSGVSLNGSY